MTWLLRYVGHVVVRYPMMEPEEQAKADAAGHTEYAEGHLSFELCHRCQLPYFAGRVDCAAGMDGEVAVARAEDGVCTSSLSLSTSLSLYNSFHIPVFEVVFHSTVAVVMVEGSVRTSSLSRVHHFSHCLFLSCVPYLPRKPKLWHVRDLLLLCSSCPFVLPRV